MEGKRRQKSLKEFNYENKVWGGGEVKVSPFYIQGLKLKYTLDAIKNVKGKILDIGCGGGNMAKAIKRERPDLKVYGIDISKTAIHAAKKNDQGVYFVNNSSESLSFKDNYFDAVVMYDVLEHVEKPAKTIKELKRVLKKDGLIHIFSPLDGQPWTLYWLILKLGWQPKNAHTGHLQVFSVNSFERLLNDYKLKITDKKYSFHFIFSIFDIAYFTFLEFIKYDPPSSIEGMIEKNKKNIFTSIFSIIYKFVVAIGHFESRILSGVPGGGGHFTIKRYD